MSLDLILHLELANSTFMKAQNINMDTETPTSSSEIDKKIK